MKKYTFAAIALILVVLGVFVSTRKSADSAKARPLTGETNITVARAESGSAPLPVSRAVDKNDGALVPLIEANEPRYASNLYVLERSFLAVLEGDKLTKNMPAERLAQLSHKLAVIRLSQSMHEAQIASVSLKGKDVAIAIPPYPKEGDYLKGLVFDQLLPDITDDMFRRRMSAQFGFFGQGSQEIDVKADVLVVEGTKMFTIEHQLNDVKDVGTINGQSVLAANQLGSYLPFVGWFPKS